MGAHESLESILSATSRQKIIGAAVIIGVLVAIVFGVMYAGHKIFGSWADSKYLQESKKRDDKIAVLESDAERHIKNETQLTAENSLLKKQNAAMAEAQKLADTDRERKALADLAKREADRAKAFGDIDADADYDSQVCATCEDYRKSGFPLSADFCRRCEVKK